MDSGRRSFLYKLAIGSYGLTVLPYTSFGKSKKGNVVITVKGDIAPSQLGTTLIHEHILVDFIGADKTGYHRWDKAEVIKKVLPYLNSAKQAGIDSIIDCTPKYLGRDVHLLKELSIQSGINILTTTGLYGARNDLFIPKDALSKSPKQLAKEWISEFKNGIENSGIKPGLIKIGVNSGNLSDFHKTLIKAAAITHKATGLTIASHTGPAVPAVEQLDILKEYGVDASAFVWVHSQNEKGIESHVKAVELGAWVSIEGVRDQKIEPYVDKIKALKKHNCLHRTLVSHDAGWYRPGEEDGGKFASFTIIHEQLIPRLLQEGFDSDDIKQIFVDNPKEAFTIKKRTLK